MFNKIKEFFKPKCACDTCIHNCEFFCDCPDWKNCLKKFKESDRKTDKRLRKGELI